MKELNRQVSDFAKLIGLFNSNFYIHGFHKAFCATRSSSQEEVEQRLINSFIMEVSITKKRVHWFQHVRDYRHRVKEPIKHH